MCFFQIIMQGDLTATPVIKGIFFSEALFLEKYGAISRIVRIRLDLNCMSDITRSHLYCLQMTGGVHTSQKINAINTSVCITELRVTYLEIDKAPAKLLKA